MTNKKSGRPPIYSGPMSDLQSDVLKDILSQSDVKSPIQGKNSDKLKNIDIEDLDEEFVLKNLKLMALQGNVKAIELLGEKFGIFETKEKETLLDIFADEGTLEENILQLLDVLEDKYPTISVDAVLNNTIDVLNDLNEQEDNDDEGSGAEEQEIDVEVSKESSEAASKTSPKPLKFLEPLEEEKEPKDVPITLSFDEPVDNFVGRTITSIPQQHNVVDRFLNK